MCKCRIDRLEKDEKSCVAVCGQWVKLIPGHGIQLKIIQH